MCDYAALIENDSIRKRKRDIYRVKYGRVSALNELMIPWILSSKKNQELTKKKLMILVIIPLKNVAIILMMH